MSKSPTVAEAINAKMELEHCIGAMVAEFDAKFGVQVSKICISPGTGILPVISLSIEIPGLTS